MKASKIKFLSGAFFTYILNVLCLQPRTYGDIDSYDMRKLTMHACSEMQYLSADLRSNETFETIIESSVD